MKLLVTIALYPNAM